MRSELTPAQKISFAIFRTMSHEVGVGKDKQFKVLMHQNCNEHVIEYGKLHYALLEFRDANILSIMCRVSKKDTGTGAG